MDETVTTLSLAVREHARRTPDKAALTIDGTTVSYSYLDALSDRIAHGLLREAIDPGDRIAVIGPACAEYVALMVASTRVGAVLAPLPASASAETLEAMIADSGARLCFEDGETLSSTPGQYRHLALRGDRLAAWLPKASGPVPDNIPSPDEAATIIYSSGTTGVPKGIVQPYLYRSRLLNGGAARGYSEDAVTLLATPLYSNTTLASFLQTIGAGGHVILQTKFDAGEWLRIAQHYGVTHSMLVPVMIQRILAHPDFDTTDLSAFRMKYCTSAPFAAEMKREVLSRWPGGLIELYGMTEGGATFVLPAHEFPDKLHTVGRLAAGCRVRIVDDQDRDLPPGTAGEVIGEAPGMMIGYHNRPDDTAECRLVEADGTVWQRTGDIGELDEEGFLTIVGRKKDMIISGGFNIYPIDIENVLATHTGIAEATVVGVPDERWGETPVAFVVLQDNGDAAEILAWANERLGRMQRLSNVVAIDTLPRGDIGKVLKRVLRDTYVASIKQAG